MHYDGSGLRSVGGRYGGPFLFFLARLRAVCGLWRVRRDPHTPRRSGLGEGFGCILRRANTLSLHPIRGFSVSSLGAVKARGFAVPPTSTADMYSNLGFSFFDTQGVQTVGALLVQQLSQSKVRIMDAELPK